MISKPKMPPPPPPPPFTPRAADTALAAGKGFTPSNIEGADVPASMSLIGAAQGGVKMTPKRGGRKSLLGGA